MSLRRTIRWKNQNFWLEELLTDRFDQALAETENQVWTRQKYFKLNRQVLSHYVPSAADFASEKQMELMLQTFWGLNQTACPDVPNDIWHRIVSRQVPLQPGLTQIARADLIACDGLGDPVIVELKSYSSMIIPLALLLQAAEYIVRLRASWKFVHAEWEPYLARFGIPTSVIVPRLFPAVVVAPPRFWSLFTRSQRFDQSLFAIVLKRFADSKLPVRFMELRENTGITGRGFMPALRIIEL